MKSAASHCIALVGFRASGKSTLGARLAEELRRPFFDLDREIELAQGRSVTALFRDDSEPAFRRIEAETLAGVIVRPGIVLAPGGGAVELASNRELLRARAFVVHLDVAVAELIVRLRNGAARPRLTGLAFEDEARAVVARRAPLYRECADAVLEVGAGESIETTWTRLGSLLPPA